MPLSFRTPLQLALSDIMDACAAMQVTPIALTRHFNDEDPADLEKLEAMATRLAKVVDEAFAEISYQAGLPRLDYCESVSNLVHDELAANIGKRALKMQSDRDEERESLSVVQAREFGTLTHVQQFGRR